MQEAWAKGLYHQIVRIILMDDADNIILQKRSSSMEVYPDKWTDSASGHVDYNESPDVAAHRELKEELGVVADLEYVDTFLTRLQIGDKTINTFNLVYKGQLNPSANIVIDTKEVSDFKRIKLSNLQTDIKAHEDAYTKYLIEIINRYAGILL